MRDVRDRARRGADPRHRAASGLAAPLSPRSAASRPSPLAPLAGRGFGAEGYVLSLLTRVMIFAIAAISLDLILGYGALVSFGHAAFLGIGAYAVGILSSHGVEDLVVQIPVALAASALFALVTGAISLRTKGVYFIMITLAFGQMLFFLAVSLAAYGGDDGMTLPARSLLFGGRAVLRRRRVLLRRPRLPRRRLSPLPLHRRAPASAGCCAARGRTRCAWRRSGFDPFRFQLAAYVISGMIAGLAGCPARQPGGVRQPGLHDLAALGRTDLHGDPRRPRHAPRRDPRRRRLPAARGAALGLHRALEDDLRAAPDPGRAVRARRHPGLAPARPRDG